MEALERIGVFDSGLGGLTVLNRCMDILPDEAFLYYADTDNVPYGDKTREEIIEYVDSAVDYMKAHSCKAFVIACNSATSAGVDYLREKYKGEIIVSIEPAVKPAILEHAHGGKVLVLATEATLRLDKFQDLKAIYCPDAICVPSPDLVRFVERGVFSGPESHFYYPNGDEVSYVEIVYLCRDYSGELCPQPGEVDELRWFAAHELPEDLSPPTARVIRQWAAEKLKNGG